MSYTFNEAWKNLRRTAPYRPPHLKEAAKDYHYQFFEAALTLVLADRNPALKWEVTRLVGDDGFDFHATLNFLGELENEKMDGASISIGGQCKVPDQADREINDKKEINRKFSTDFMEMGQASVLIACLAARVPSDTRRNARKDFAEIFRRPVELITLAEIVQLFRANKEKIHILMKEFGFSERECGAIIPFITDNEESPDCDGIKLAVDSPPFVNCGEIFDVQIRVLSPPTLLKNCRLSYHPPENAGGLKLINGGHIEGTTLDRWASYPRMPAVLLRFLNYQPGPLDLGSLRVLVGNDVKAETALGCVTANETFIPSFFEQAKGIRQALSTLEEQRRQSLGGMPRWIAVTGRGGNGKSRICQEAAIKAENQGALSLSLPHTKSLDSPYRILAQLICGLVPAAEEDRYRPEFILDFVGVYNQNLAKESLHTVHFICSQILGEVSGKENKNETSQHQLSPAICTRLIVFLIRMAAQRGPVFLHLSNMHWASPDVLTILTHVARLLREAGPKGVTVVLEGRNKEALDGPRDTIGAAPTSAVFEDFVSRMDIPRLEIEPLEPSESESFINHLFEDRRVAPGLPHDPRLDARDANLRHHLNRRGGGNPMHLIEVLRMLKQQNKVAVNPISNRIFVTERLELNENIPDTVNSAVLARYHFLETETPGVAKFLTAIALHKDHCSGETFKALKNRFCPQETSSSLKKTEFINIDGGAAFRHELYFEIIRTETALAEREKIDALDIHLSDPDLETWRKGAVSGLEKGRLLRKHPQKRGEAKGVLTRTAETADKQDLSVVRRDALDLLRQEEPMLHPSEVTDETLTDFLEQSKIRRDYTELNLWHGDRIESVETLAAVCDSFRDVRRQNLPNRLEEFEAQSAECLISLANACLTQFESYRAVSSLRQALTLIAPWADESNLDSPGYARWVEKKQNALNRQGVAYRFEGQPELARSCNAEVFDLFRRRATAEKLIYHIDRARAVGLDNPLDALRLLRGLNDEQLECGEETTEKRACLLENSLLGAALMCHGLGVTDDGKEVPDLDEIDRRIEKTYFNAKRAGLVRDTGAAALLKGCAAGFRGDAAQALAWFEDCRDIAFQKNHLELLWRAHVNAGQLASCPQVRLMERAQEHLRLALRLLIAQDLDGRPASSRETRLRMLRLPLMQMNRVASLLRDEASTATIGPFLPEASLEEMRDATRGYVDFMTVADCDLILP